MKALYKKRHTSILLCTLKSKVLSFAKDCDMIADKFLYKHLIVTNFVPQNCCLIINSTKYDVDNCGSDFLLSKLYLTNDDFKV